MLHFKKTEFFCGCGCGMGIKHINPKLIARLDIARAIAKTPFKITSSIRCTTYNAAVGGSENSSHISGHAVDIAAPSSAQRFKIIYGLIKAGFNRIGVYSSFIHADIDESKTKNVIWTGAKNWQAMKIS